MMTTYDPFDDDASGITEELLADALEHWRDEAIKAHPKAAPLREYLTSGSKAGVMALAEELAGKLPDVAPSAHVPGGSPALRDSQPDKVSETTRAYRENPTNGNFSALLRARYHEAGLPYVDEL